MAATSPNDDFLGFLEDDRLEIPHVPNREHPKEVGGQTYYIDSPDAETGMKLAALGELIAKQAAGIDLHERDIARLKISDDEEEEFGHKVLGDVYDQMAADGVNYEHRRRAVQYAFMAFAFSQDQALKMAERGELSGKAVAPANRAARRAKASSSTGSRKTAPKRSTSSGKAGSR